MLMIDGMITTAFPSPPLTSAEALLAAINAALAEADRHLDHLDHQAAVVEDTRWHPDYEPTQSAAEEQRKAWHAAWETMIAPALITAKLPSERIRALELAIRRELDAAVERQWSSDQKEVNHG